MMKEFYCAASVGVGRNSKSILPLHLYAGRRSKRTDWEAVMQRVFLIILAFVSLASCAVNPVTGERELTLISESQEIALGEQNYVPSRQMQGGDYEIDPALTAYVKEVGMRLAKVADRQLPYEFVVLNNSIPNAWALPGGKIAVNRGLLLELENEASEAIYSFHHDHHDRL